LPGIYRIVLTPLLYLFGIAAWMLLTPFALPLGILFAFNNSRTVITVAGHKAGLLLSATGFATLDTGKGNE